MLEVNNLFVGYGDLPVLEDVSLNVPDGSITCILGPNAAGKSTLLKTISGTVKARSGSIVLDGVPTVRMQPASIAAMGLAHVPENRRVFPNLSVLENLEVGSYIKTAKKARKETLEYVYSIFPKLKERFKQRAGTLSGGEQQMLAIARGLMLKPKLLMLDEPSLGLAPIVVREVFVTIKKINEDGVTILLVEQNASMAMSVLNEGYVLYGGRVMASGGKEALMHDSTLERAYFDH